MYGKTEISKHFKYFFASVGTNLSHSIKYNDSKTISPFLKQRVTSSLNFESVSVKFSPIYHGLYYPQLTHLYEYLETLYEVILGRMNM